MHGLDVEYRRLNGHLLSSDLAQHLNLRCWHGKAVIVTDKPISMLASTRKQWLHIIRRMNIERAGTRDHEKIQEYTARMPYISRLCFTAKAPTDFLEADVTFAMAEDLILYAPDCATMYIAYDIPKETLHMITSWMPRRGLVVIYVQD